MHSPLGLAAEIQARLLRHWERIHVPAKEHAPGGGRRRSFSIRRDGFANKSCDDAAGLLVELDLEP
jgi:hypothetical protein